MSVQSEQSEENFGGTDSESSNDMMCDLEESSEEGMINKMHEVETYSEGHLFTQKIQKSIIWKPDLGKTWRLLTQIVAFRMFPLVIVDLFFRVFMCSLQLPTAGRLLCVVKEFSNEDIEVIC